MKTYFKVIPAVFLILEKEEKVLLLRRFNTGYKDGEYSLVAGHLEGGESARAALAREAKEEAGITIHLEDLREVVTMHRQSAEPVVHERIDLFFTAEKWQGEPRNMEPEKCDDLSWFPLDNLPPNTIDCVKATLETYKAGQTYLEFGF